MPLTTGANCSALSSSNDLSLGRNILPPITAVICNVNTAGLRDPKAKAAAAKDGGGGRLNHADNRGGRLSPGDAAAIHSELTALFCSVTRQLPGGYFVSDQGGELAYMMAFSSPEVGRQLPGSFWPLRWAGSYRAASGPLGGSLLLPSL